MVHYWKLSPDLFACIYIQVKLGHMKYISFVVVSFESYAWRFLHAHHANFGEHILVPSSMIP